MTTLSPCLLDPHIDLTSEETQWRDVSLWYWMVMKDEFEHNDRLKYFAVKWLLENRKWPHFIDYSEGDIYQWHWTSIGSPKERRIKDHARVFTIDFADWISEVAHKETYHRDYCKGHDSFGSSILWFCSLWPRFYLEVVLPTQEGEPENADEFWENFGLCIDKPECMDAIRQVVFKKSGTDWSNSNLALEFDYLSLSTAIFNADRTKWGNAVLRSVKAWKGDKE